MTAEHESERLAASLQRIDDLVTTLDALSHTGAREPARELLETVLDLYGLALTRMVSLIASSAEGPATMARFADDPRICAVLLLHGLHPEELGSRVRKTVDQLGPRLARYGASLHLIAISGAKARLQLRGAGPGHGNPALAVLREEIEEALTEAAPDLGEIEIEDARWHEGQPSSAAYAAALTG